MRQLNKLDLNIISGRGTVTYPVLLPGQRLIGWEQTFLYYEEQTSIDYGIFIDTVYITKIPIYQITPVVTYY